MKSKWIILFLAAAITGCKNISDTVGDLQADDSPKEQIVPFDLDGKQASLKFYVMSRGKQKMVLPSREEGYGLTPIPNKDAYVLEYNGSLYAFDAVNGTISKLLSDHAAGYDRVSLSAKQVDGLPLIWGERSRVSPSGDYLLFYSNRNAVQHGYGDGELWMKNLNTNEEEVVYSGPFEYAGWGSHDHVFIRDQDQIYEINLDTKTAALIAENVSLESAVVYPYLVQPALGKIAITDMTTHASVSITEGIGRVDMVLGEEGSKQIAMKHYPDPASFDNNILVMTDPLNGSFQIISPPNGYVIDTFSWMDSENLWVTATQKGSNVKESYLVTLHP